MGSNHYTQTTTQNMTIKYLLLVLAAAIAPTTPDARIVFQQQTKIFLPKNDLQTTPTSPTSTTTTTTSSRTEVVPFNSSRLCPENEDCCDSPADYPEDTILAAALSQDNTIRSLFDSQAVQPRKGLTEFGQFVADDLENICSVRTDYILPRAAKNKDGEYKYIVNHPSGAEEYVQQVRVTICKEAEKSCGHGLLEDTGLRTSCRQEYSDHKLVALSATGEELQVETFQFPSCCTCYISHFTEY